jgi:glycosyltransferase involved in cell wall biosynthesis
MLLKMSNITIIIPFFNEDDTLRLTMDALMGQTLKADKILMIDSGSTDTSATIINEYVNSNDKSIELFQPMLGSPSSSINYGLKNVKTKYVAYVDCGLEIPENWLESQYKLLVKKNDLIVSMRIYTDGNNILDKSLIAQTYGYKNKTTCFPGSLMDMNIFKSIGVLEENMRAGYDVDFINRLNKFGIKRLVNKNIALKYLGVNYAKDYILASKKIFNYSLSGWKTEGDYKPHIYMIFVLLILFSIGLGVSLKLFLFYIIIRGYFIPYIKSKNLFEESDLYFYLMLPISAIVFDISRTSGYLFGIKNFIMDSK